jgi:phytoene dehydrogenase-like protein
MKKKKVIVIGAGLAGMSVGSYLQMNGFDTEIFESHNACGGLCTSWKRGDYFIDGCIHFMTGTSPDQNMYQFWNNLIDMPSIDFVYADYHFVIEDENHNRLYIYSNIDKLESELLLKAPEDKKLIIEFIRLVRKFINIKLPVSKPMETMTFKDKLKAGYSLFPYLLSIRKYINISNSEFAAKFKNPLVRNAFETAFGGYQPLFYSIMPLVWRHQKDTGYPLGGAIYISKLIENNYKLKEGKIHYNSRVEKIITENNKAKGIILENGETHYADIVISAADGRSTIYKMLEGKFKDKSILERYESDLFKTIDKTLYVSLGVNVDFSDQPIKLYFPVKTPIVIDPKTTLTALEITHYCCDPGSAPKEKSLIALMPEANDWEYWHNLRINNHQKYNEEKNRVANAIIEALDERFGNIKQNIEMVDVATPATYIRYTNNWTGGQISWKSTKSTFGKPIIWQIKGLSDFYMTGQWAGTSGGLNNVVMMGNHLTQIICKNEGIHFKH